ncbi:hypothetical protein LY78DRAFT_450070 [Colletotrichum sublineola]|nr:hypothetical protein LY78DRAFT_450070 [Colletotrichum sublineola]
MLRRQQLLVLRRKICFRSLRGPVALAVLQQLGLLPAGCDKLGAQIRLHCHGNPDGPLVHLFAPGKRPSFASCLNEVPSEQPVICKATERRPFSCYSCSCSILASTPSCWACRSKTGNPVVLRDDMRACAPNEHCLAPSDIL